MMRHAARNRSRFAYRLLSVFIAFTFSLTSILPPGYAQVLPQTLLNLPVPGAMVTPTPAFVPVLLKGMIIHPDNPLQFDFIIDSGNTDFKEDKIKIESERLVKYFLASMTIPKDDLWVNLSPYESDKIIPEELGKTELGRDMLAQDYILKQLTASLMYPEKELGKEFWAKIYQKAQEKYGTTKIPVDTFNKVWILPETATVYEHGQTVYIVEARLRVMLDSDYQARQYKEKMEDGRGRGEGRTSGQHPSSNLDFQSSIIKEIILPAIEKEVNEGQNFAPLRQIYHSLILAKWYKETIKNSLLSKIYIDQKKIAGVNLDDTTLKDQIYAQYMEAYKKGVFNYIKEDYDRLSDETIPRKYFSGGEELTKIPLEKTTTPVTESHNSQYVSRIEITPQKQGTSFSKDSSSPIEEHHLSDAELRLLREPNEVGGFISKRGFDENRVRKQLAQILPNIQWWKTSPLLTEEEKRAIREVEEQNFLAGPGTGDEHYMEEEWYQDLVRRYNAAAEKRRLIEAEKITEVINWVKADIKKHFKGEEVHILDGVGRDGKVIGRLDRKIAEKYGYIHETANVVLLTPDGKVLLQLRNKDNYDDHLAMYGGHLEVGQSYFPGVIKETLQETRLKFEEMEGEPIPVDYEGYDEQAGEGDNNRERRSWFVKVLTGNEYRIMKERKEAEERDLGIDKATTSRAEYKSKLFEIQKRGTGEGEVVGTYEFTFDKIAGAASVQNPGSPYKDKTNKFLKVSDIFNGREETIDAFFTPDALERLVSPKNTQLWAKIKETAAKILSERKPSSDSPAQSSSPLVIDEAFQREFLAGVGGDTRTFVMINPDALERGQKEAVVREIERQGFAVEVGPEIRLTTAQASEFYQVHQDRPFFKDLITFITSGPVIPLFLKANGAVEKFNAVKDEVRKTLGVVDIKATSNRIHAADSVEHAVEEAKVVFQAVAAQAGAEGTPSSLLEMDAKVRQSERLLLKAGEAGEAELDVTRQGSETMRKQVDAAMAMTLGLVVELPEGLGEVDMAEELNRVNIVWVRAQPRSPPVEGHSGARRNALYLIAENQEFLQETPTHLIASVLAEEVIKLRAKQRILQNNLTWTDELAERAEEFAKIKTLPLRMNILGLMAKEIPNPERVKADTFNGKRAEEALARLKPGAFKWFEDEEAVKDLDGAKEVKGALEEGKLAVMLFAAGEASRLRASLLNARIIDNQTPLKDYRLWNVDLKNMAQKVIENLELLRKLKVDGEGQLNLLEGKDIDFASVINRLKEIYVTGDIYKEINKINPDRTTVKRLLKSDIQDLSAVIEHFSQVDVQRQVAGAKNLKLGRRHLMALREGIRSDARTYGFDAEKVIRNMKVIITVNLQVIEDVKEDLMANRFYGFTPQNVYLVVNDLYPGMVYENGKWMFDRASRVENLTNYNHGFNIINATQKGVGYRYDRTKGRFVLEGMRSVFDMVKTTAETVVVHRINDMMLLDSQLAMDTGMYAVYQHRRAHEGTNVMVDVLNNLTGQKGGLWMTTSDHAEGTGFLLEGLAAKTAKIEGALAILRQWVREKFELQDIPYNRLYMYFDIEAVEEGLRENGGIIPLSVKDDKPRKGVWSPEIPSGDITIVPGLKVGAVIRGNDTLIDGEIFGKEKPAGYEKDKQKGAIIHDFKQLGNLPETMKIVLHQDRPRSSSSLTGSERSDQRGGIDMNTISPVSMDEAMTAVNARLEAVYPDHPEYRDFINNEFIQKAAELYGRRDILDVQQVMDLRIQAAVTRGHGKKVIMFVAEEGWAKKGGQGDYIRELGEALAAQGHMVLIVNPYFQKKNEKSDISPADGEGLVTSEIPVGAGALPMTTFYNNVEGLNYLRFRGSEQEIQALLYPEVYPDEKKDGVYYSDSLYGYVESILLSKAAMHIDKVLGLELDVLHFNDWQAALGPVYMELVYRQHPDYRPFLQNTGTVVIAHNLAYQGSKFNGEIQISKDDPLLYMLRSRAILGEDRVRFQGETAIVTLYDAQRDYHDPHAADKILINLPPEVLSDSDRGLEFWSNKVAGRHNFLKGGIIFANLVTAVSKGNMEEIQGSDQFGFGLEGVLAEKAREGGLGYVYNGLSFKKNKPEYLSVLNEEVEGERFTQFSENDSNDVLESHKLQNKRMLARKISTMKASVEGDFSKLLEDKALFSDLVENGYLDANGEIQNKFRLLPSESKLIVKENYIPQKKNIYKVLKKKDEIHGELGAQGIENDLVEAIVSRLVSQKGYDILFEKIDEAGTTLIEKILSLRGVQGEKIRLVIMASAGDDTGLKSAEKLRELVNKDQYKGQIVFLEMFDPKLAQQVLAGADSFFMPSAYEPGGISNLQAAMNGLLTILTLTGGLKDFVEMGGTLEKFAVAPFNSNDKQSMARAAKDFAVVFAEALTLFGEHREQWIAAARQAMRIEADWSDKVDSYIDLYNKAMAKAHSSSPVAADREASVVKREAQQDTRYASRDTNDEDVGGIDMNAIDLERRGAGVDIQFDPAELQEIIDAGIDGFAPVIINIVPLPSVLPLLGLEPRKEEDGAELSRVN